MMFFNAFVRSRMTYACQTWTLTAKQLADLNTADAYLKRRMIRNGFKRRGDPKKASNQHLFQNLSTPSVKNSLHTLSANQTLDTPNNFSSTTTNTIEPETTADPCFNKLLLHGTSTNPSLYERRGTGSFNEIRDLTMETPTFSSSKDVVQNN
jgi:hypothetical protein